MTPFDTKPSIQEKQDEAIRRMTGAARLRLAMDMSDAARALAFARIRQQHPNASEALIIREFLRSILSFDQIPVR